VKSRGLAEVAKHLTRLLIVTLTKEPRTREPRCCGVFDGDTAAARVPVPLLLFLERTSSNSDLIRSFSESGTGGKMGVSAPSRGCTPPLPRSVARTEK